MEPIQSISSGYAAPSGSTSQIRPTQVTGAGNADHVAATSSAQAGVTSISASESVTSLTMSQQVESFLGGIDPALQNNAYLKLLIAALIMQVLLGEDGGAEQSGAGLQSLQNLSGGRNTALFISIESSTNTVQMQQQSYQLDINSAVQTMTESASSGEQSGRQMDVTG